MKKYLLLVIVSSLIICILSLLAGALNWFNQLAVVLILYFGSGLLFDPQKLNFWKFSAILILPFFLIYGYVTIRDSLIHVYPICFAPFFAIFFGIILKKYSYPKSKQIFAVNVFIFIVLTSSISYVLMPNWTSYFLGAKHNVHNAGKISGLKLYDLNGQEYNDNKFIGKITVFDFWNSSCGVCYHDFPYFERLVEKYKTDTNIVFYSVNMPLPRDTVGLVKFNNALNYKFNQLSVRFETEADINQKFKIIFYPTLVILDKQMNLYFSGSYQYEWRYFIDNAYCLINKLTK